MKLHSVRLQNYRKHADLTVDLAADRTLITGPNETGKSTLIEAIHRCLFYRHRSKAAGLQERMQPKTGGDPTVTLEFSLGDTRYTLHKKFRGPTGSQAVLSDDAGGHWEGDPAEEKLQTLLGVEEARGQQAQAFNSQWAHLWVWQGSAQDEPSGKATGSTAQQLREQLQQQGGLGVIASQRDEAVKAAFAREADEIFTKSGKPKKGSRLGEAEQRVSDAQENATAAEQQWLAGQQAADNLAEAEQTLTEQTRRKEEMEKALVPLRQRQAEANELKAALDQQQQAAEQAAARLQTVISNDAAITQIAQQAAEVAARIAPAEQSLADLLDQHRVQTQAAADAAKALKSARQRLSAVQQQRDLLAAQRSMLHAASDAGKLGNLLERLAAADETINTLTRQLDAIPAIDQSAIDDLAELEKNLERAELAVQMVATRIDISEAASEICIAERPFTAGEASIITEPTEITFAGGTRLLITPGGGTSLADARLAAAEAKQKLQAHLTELGVIDRPSAIQRLAAREQFSRQIAQHRQEVATLLDGESQTAARDREQVSRQKLATAEQRVAAILERAESDQPEPALPADLAKVNDAMEPVDAEYDNLQQSVNDLSKRHENAVRSQEISADAVQETEEKLSTDRENLNKLQIKQQTLEQEYGDPETRADALSSATQAHKAAVLALEASQQKLNDLDLVTLDADIERYERAISNADEKLKAAENAKTVAHTSLQHLGGQGLHERWAAATAALEAANREHAAAATRAKAIAMVRDRFGQLSGERADQIAAPLRLKTEEYLTTMFGPGTRVSLALADDQSGFSDLRVVRPSADASNFAFEELSGGAREQVAAGLRLAMAEILADRYGGSLPIVFDDAFTNSDPQRIQLLQRMLDLAARRGLQVIVLSCNPADYHTFGATEIDLAALIPKSM